MSVQDIKIKKIPITLDKPRNLVFDLNAFCELEDRFGDINAAFQALENGSVKAIRTLLWVGLIHEDENLTEKQVGKLVTFDNVQEIAEKINQAMSKSLPEEKNSEPSPPEN